MKINRFFYFFLVLAFLISCREDDAVLIRTVSLHSVYSFSDELEYLYRLDLLPQYRDNTTVEQVSSYDTTGGNNDGFSGLYSYIRKEGDKLIIADLQGPGVIERIWTPTPSEDTIQFYFDGETEPRISIRFIDLFSGKQYPFITPIVGNEVGGYYSYLPIPYQQSCKIVYIGDQLYFHQIQYRKFNGTTGPESFRMELNEAENTVLRRAARFWESRRSDIESYIDSINTGQESITQSFTISPGETVDLLNLEKAGRILKFELVTTSGSVEINKDLLIKILWDDEDQPAVFCPVIDFFGYAFGKPSTRSILHGSESGINYCFIPMPFDSRAKFELIYAKRGNADQPAIALKSSIGFVPERRNPAFEGKFYTQWKRIIHPEEGEPYIFQESSGKGHHFGTILQARGLSAGMTRFFEGDDSTLVDHTLRLHGTGSEDYFNGGWYALPNRWDRAFSLPIHGCLEYSIPLSRTGGYRFYLTDKISYRQHFLHTIEHGPEGNRYPVDYTSIAFYYGEHPPTEIMEPREELREIYLPDTLIITPDLMKVTVGLYNAVSRIDWGKFMFHGDENSIMVVHLDEIPRGKYGMYISFLKSGEGCDFSIWQRQKRVSETISSHSENVESMEDLYIGDINLNENYPSVTLMKEAGGSGNHLVFTKMMFVKKGGEDQ
ncbi:MAG: DUF2961 domain-containing protein [Cyclobacteriaceae bacterium]|nr:DUF2961 domain-containing protein [Cyclobacteriaceae bacterium]